MHTDRDQPLPFSFSYSFSSPFSRFHPFFLAPISSPSSPALTRLVSILALDIGIDYFGHGWETPVCMLAHRTNSKK